MKEALKSAFWYCKENGVVISEFGNEQGAGNMWFRTPRKHHESWCLRKPTATSLTWSTSVNCKNVKAIFENLKKLTSRHNFTDNKIYTLD
jgi:hypothetical protein